MTPPAIAGDGGDDLRVMIARLEGKVDAALAGTGAVVAEHARRIDALEAQRSADDARLRAVEQRPTVSPRAMLAATATAVTATAALVTALAPFIDRLYS